MRPIAKLEFGESPITGMEPQDIAASNMYLTFWYAQGESGLDSSLAGLIQDQYARTWSEDDWREASLHVGDMQDESFLKLGMPLTHVDPRATGGDGKKQGSYHDTVRDEFETRWRKLGYAFDQDRLGAAQRLEAAREENLRRAEERMIYCDFRYNTGDRKRRFSPDDDPHQSMYRSYVLEGRPTGSEEFDTIFAELRQRFIEDGPPDGHVKTGDGMIAGYKEMVVAWEANHPGETFEPQDHDIQLGLLRGEIRDRTKLAASLTLPLGSLILAIKDRFTRR